MVTTSSPEVLSQGLDRAALSVYDPGKTHEIVSLSVQQEQQKSVPNGGPNSPRTEGPGTLGNVRRRSKSARIKAKIGGLLQIKGDRHGPEESSHTRTLAPKPMATTGEDRLFRSVPKREYPSVKEIIHNPLKVIQSEVNSRGANQFAKTMDNKAISHGADVRIVNAYDKIASLSTESDKDLGIQDLNELKDARQDLFVRWTMDHHVRKVRRLPATIIPWRSREDFTVTDELGKRRMQWERYAHHV